MKFSTRLAALALATATASLAHAAPVNVFSNTVAAGNQVVTFNEVTGGTPPGTAYNSVLAIGNVSFAERFAGQSVSTVGGFDALSGAPSGPLALTAGATGANLAVANFPSVGPVLVGVGAGLFPNTTALGVGSVSALFSVDQAELGFDIIGTNNGSASVSFFRRDGSLIDSLVLSLASDWSWTFRREGAVSDIAGFAITNTDTGGVGYRNVRFSTNQGGATPEPGSLALVGLALVGAYAVRRKVKG